MRNKPPAKRCPTCGQLAMRRVVRSIETTVGGKRTEVPNIEVEECGACGERLYDLIALRKIREARGPARRTKVA